MNKQIIELNQDERGHTYTLIEVSDCTPAEHKEAREELKKVTIRSGSNSGYGFFLVNADSDSFQAKCWGNGVEELEKIGYSF